MSDGKTGEASILWRDAEAAEAVKGRLEGRPWAASGVEIDTRALKPGDLFVVLQGAARDGHDFVAQALEKGAAAAMVARRPADAPADAPLLLVDDTLTALERLGAAARARATAMKAVAVTGSVGKTSTKEMLAAMLATAGSTHAAVKSFNNHIGVPLTLARTSRDRRFGVYEIGMNAPGEIAPLSRLVGPDVALITTVDAVHLAAFESVDGIADEKASIFEGLRSDGVAVVNADLDCSDRLRARARACGAAEVLDFGESGGDARLIAARIEREATVVEAEILGRRLAFEIGAPGRHFALNALGALLSAQRLGADLQSAAAALEGWRAVSGRGARVDVTLSCGGALTLIDESYNANPASLRAALAAFAARPAPRRVAFLTDMLELGAEGAALHAAIAAAPGVEALDQIHTAGPLCEALHRALPAARRGEHHADAESLAARVRPLLRPGDAVMVKGSLGSRAQKIAAAIRALGAGDQG